MCPDPDDLYLSGGGTTIVATDAMLGDERALSMVAFELGAVLGELRIAAEASGRLCQAGGLPDALDRAQWIGREAHDAARDLAAGLRAAMTGYSAAEAQAEWLAVNGAAAGGWLVGASLSASAAALLGPYAPLAAGLLPWIVRGAGDTGEKVGPDDVEMSDDLTRTLSDPANVMALRLAVSSADEAVAGAGGVPLALESLLEGSGSDGVQASAALLAGYASIAGLLTETPVAVTKTDTRTGHVTHGFASRFDKEPVVGESPGGAQIRIDTLSTPGEPDRFEVYIGGTVDFSPVPAKDAFDLTSNVAGVAGLPAGSLRAVRQAMADAGITHSSAVTLTGYSQGGLVAAMLASSGDYDVRGVVTIGAPAGGVALPSGIPAVIVEHMEDFVPALGGVQTNTDALVVRRQAFASLDDLPEGLSAPGHRMEYYRQTAVLMDHARSEQLINAATRLDAFSAGAESVTSSYYYASRLG